MKTLKTKKILLIAVLLSAVLCLAGCEPTHVEPAKAYTEQTARAIIYGAEHVGFCMILAALVRGILNK